MSEVRPAGAAGPLVIDFTTAWSGPLCTAVLADFGWDVVKVETESRPDVTRRLGPYADEIPGLERSGYFETLNRGKRSTAINLATGEGRALARRLCESADVVVENFSPGVMAKLGLDYETLRAVNPSLVMVSISGYGQSGPERSSVAYGQTIEAFSGLDAATGYGGDQPMACGAPIADHVAGMTAALAAFGAIHRRGTSGEGCLIDLSMVEAMLAITPGGVVEHQLSGAIPRPSGNADPEVAPHGCYPCQGEDRWVAFEARSEDQWRAVCHVLGAGSLPGDARFARREARIAHRKDLDEALAQATAAFDAGKLAQVLRAAGAPATAVLDGDGLRADETIQKRDFFSPVDHPVAGSRNIPGRQAVLSWLPPALPGRSPLLGEHTNEVLGSLLGISDDEIEQLARAGILR